MHSSGTFDVQNVTIRIEGIGIIVQTEYFEKSNAIGAFFIFASLDSTEVPDLDTANYLALDKNISLHFLLPLRFDVGRQIVLVYDIESHGHLANGELYPAINREFVVTRNITSGTQFAIMS